MRFWIVDDEKKRVVAKCQKRRHIFAIARTLETMTGEDTDPPRHRVVIGGKKKKAQR